MNMQQQHMQQQKENRRKALIKKHNEFKAAEREFGIYSKQAEEIANQYHDILHNC